MEPSFDKEVEAALEVLRRGGTILYPTDTVWGIGCDATDSRAVARIFEIKKREDTKSMIVLVAGERDIMHYVAAPDPGVFDFLQQQARPTTVIFDGALGLPANLVAADGSIAIRIVRDEFCRHLVRRLRRPLVSTSANISGQPTPQTFPQVAPEIKAAVAHVVQWRQSDETPALPSQIVKWNRDGTHVFIRK